MKEGVTVQANGRKLYNLEESSYQLGDTPVWTLRHHIAAGHINVTRLGRRLFLTAQELERIAREGLPSLGAEAEVSAA
jgi:hypothetical protein